MASRTRTYSRTKLAGQVYTPPELVQRTLDAAGYTGPGIVGRPVLDPACGDGRFLLEVVRRIVAAASPEHLPDALRQVHGWDIDGAALAACRTALDALVAPREVDWQLHERNTLEAHGVSSERFAFIVGNPPYVRIQHLSEADRQLVRSRFALCRSGSTDLYIAFFELALGLLDADGVCAFVTPNTFFYTDTGRALRRTLVADRRLRGLVNFGSRQVFPDATTYTAITVLGQRPTERFFYADASGDEPVVSEIETASLAGARVWRFGPALESPTGPTRPLGQIAHVHVGLATLADPVFLVEPVEQVGRTVMVRSKHLGRVVPIEGGLVRPAIKGSKVRLDQPCEADRWIVFPYISEDGGRPRCLTEAEMMDRFPLGHAYLTACRERLEQRDDGRPNPVAWFAFGRSQGLETSFGEKLIFSPMARTPTFVVCRDPLSTVYSGYFIKFDGDLERLAAQLNSPRMAAFVQGTSRDFQGGWKAYTKRVVEGFPVELEAL